MLKIKDEIKKFLSRHHSTYSNYQVKRALVEAKAQRWKQRSGIKSPFSSKFQFKEALVDAKF